MSEYDNVAQTALKLKGVSDHGIKKYVIKIAFIDRLL
jgi:hypothetical protein